MAIMNRNKINLIDALQQAYGKTKSVIQGLTKGRAQEELGISRKNWIINGDMQVSQRGDFTTATSANAAGGVRYSLDRWYHYVNGGTDFVRHNTTTLPTGEVVRTMYNECVTGTNTFLHPAQRVEFPKGTHTVTISFWYKTNNANVTTRICGTACITGKSLIADEQWHYISDTMTITTPDTGILQVHSGFMNPCVAGDYIEFTNVKLEIGDTATPFEVEPYAEVLRKCQRYYQVLSLRGNTVAYTPYQHYFSVQTYQPMYYTGGIVNTSITNLTVEYNITNITSDVDYIAKGIVPSGSSILCVSGFLNMTTARAIQDSFLISGEFTVESEL